MLRRRLSTELPRVGLCAALAYALTAVLLADPNLAHWAAAERASACVLAFSFWLLVSGKAGAQ